MVSLNEQQTNYDSSINFYTYMRIRLRERRNKKKINHAFPLADWSIAVYINGQVVSEKMENDEKKKLCVQERNRFCGGECYAQNVVAHQ